MKIDSSLLSPADRCRRPPWPGRPASRASAATRAFTRRGHRALVLGRPSSFPGPRFSAALPAKSFSSFTHSFTAASSEKPAGSQRAPSLLPLSGFLGSLPALSLRRPASTSGSRSPVCSWLPQENASNLFTTRTPAPCREWTFNKHPFFCTLFIYFNWRLITLQYCRGFAIH